MDAHILNFICLFNSYRQTRVSGKRNGFQTRGTKFGSQLIELRGFVELSNSHLEVIFWFSKESSELEEQICYCWQLMLVTVDI